MRLPIINKAILLLQLSLLICGTSVANDIQFQYAKTLQRNGEFDQAIEAYKSLLTQSVVSNDITDEQLFLYTESLVQLMNTFQSKGEPDECILALEEVFSASPILQKQCLRDYYAVMGYALSRTEKMTEAEETMIKALSMPLYHPTPERYFRDYAYAAAVFYSNPDYLDEVIDWCQQAIEQAELCENTSGVQWVRAMMGSLYKRSGELNKALELFNQCKNDAQQKGDDLGVLNSLNMLVDFFLYWNIPEYANIYASQAIEVERNMTIKNPMVSTQTYINKGRALSKLGERDSVLIYTEQARNLCQSLPYNSGMVDVDLLHGSTLTEMGGDDINLGIQALQQATIQGTQINQAKAYHQLAQTYLKCEEYDLAEKMLDRMYTLLNQSDTPIYIDIDYEPILNHYLKEENHAHFEQYARLMLQEQEAFKEDKLNFNIVDTIVASQTEQVKQELLMAKLRETNQRLRFIIFGTIAAVFICIIALLIIHQKRRYKIRMKETDERFALLIKKLDQSNIEKQKEAQEIKEFLLEKDNRQKMETLTPHILKEGGETKFRQCFELLHPLFLHRLREKVPSITRREELLSMLIVLKQDNKDIAELLSIAPRSVLMLRHRFRQKIGLATEYPLENFIEDTLNSNQTPKTDA